MWTQGEVWGPLCMVQRQVGFNSGHLKLMILNRVHETYPPLTPIPTLRGPQWDEQAS